MVSDVVFMYDIYGNTFKLDCWMWLEHKSVASNSPHLCLLLQWLHVI